MHINKIEQCTKYFKTSILGSYKSITTNEIIKTIAGNQFNIIEVVLIKYI